jgi:hypothetical protein
MALASEIVIARRGTQAVRDVALTSFNKKKDSLHRTSIEAVWAV